MQTNSMGEKIKRFFAKIGKFNLKLMVFKLVSKIVDRKKQISVGASVMTIILLGSFLIEYYGFGHKLHALEESDAGVITISNADVVVENFSLNEQDVFVSQAENASLVLDTHDKYVQNLELELGENPNYNITVKYTDPKTKQEIVLEKNLQKSMQKNKLNFLNFVVFKIQNSPEKITIIAANPQTSISEIVVDNSFHFNCYRFIFVFGVGVLIFIFVIFRERVGKKPEYVFFTVAMVCGSLIAFSETRSFVSWDEAIHYDRADSNSFKNVVVKKVDDIYAKTNSVPASYSLKEQGVIDGYFDGDRKDKVKKSKLKFGDFSLVEFYNQLGYIPSGMALMVGRIIHLPYHLVFIFGRWINILLFSSVVFFAIRKLKSGKMIMSIVALFPTSIFLASNYGYDSWVTAFTLLGLAYLFSELQQPEKKIIKKDAIIMLGAFVIGLGPKAIYFPLMLLLFLLKKEKFESLGQYKKFIWASIFSILFVIGSFMLPFVIGGPGKGDRRGGSEVNSAQQVGFILSNPVAYSKILFNFMKNYIDPRNAGGLVSSFAYLGSIKGFWLVMTALAVATITDKNKYDKEVSDLKAKALMIVIYLGTVALISTALYIAFTPVRSVFISGVQPRYLIPLIFPLLFVVGSSRIKNPFNKNIYNTIIFGIMAIVLLQGIWQLITSLHY